MIRWVAGWLLRMAWRPPEQVQLAKEERVAALHVDAIVARMASEVVQVQAVAQSHRTTQLLRAYSKADRAVASARRKR